VGPRFSSLFAQVFFKLSKATSLLAERSAADRVHAYLNGLKPDTRIQVYTTVGEPMTLSRAIESAIRYDTLTFALRAGPGAGGRRALPTSAPPRQLAAAFGHAAEASLPLATSGNGGQARRKLV
jgi:hypothetical protein